MIALSGDAKLTRAPLTERTRFRIRKGDSTSGSFSSDYVGGSYRWPDGTYKSGFDHGTPVHAGGLRAFQKIGTNCANRIFQDAR